MAIVWGNPMGTSGHYVRVGIDMTVPTPRASDSAVTVTTKYYIQAMVNCYDDNNTAQITGNAGTYTGPIAWRIYNDFGYWDDRNIVLLKTINTSVATSYSGVKVESNFNYQNIEYAGGTLNVYVSKQMAARPYSAPPAPTSASKTYVSDTQYKIAWAAGVAGTGNPVQGYRIIRYSTDNGNGETIASVASTAREYIDNSAKADTAYNYSVYAYNSGGNSSATSTGPDTFTSPKAPSNVQVSKKVSDILVTWTDNSRIESSYEIHDYVNGSSTPTLVGTVGAGVTSWTYAAPDAAKTHTLAVRAVRTRSDGPTLYSALVKSGTTVQLLAPPNAPTNLNPNGSWFDATVMQTFSMTHNPVDGTAITAIEYQYRVTGSATWTLSGKQSSADNKISPTPSRFANSNDYEWQARTWGQHADPSPWSNTATFHTAPRPVGTITSPTAANGANGDMLTVDWDYASQYGAKQGQVMLILKDDAGNTLERMQMVGDVTIAQMSTRLKNDTYYRLELQVWDANGIPSDLNTVRFLVTFVSPPQADVNAVWDSSMGAVTLTINNPTTATGAIPDRNVIYRLDTGDEVWLDTVGLNTSIKDPIPPAGDQTTYLIRTISTIGSTATRTVSVATPNPGSWYWLNAGQHKEVFARFRLGVGGPKISSTFERETVLKHFAGRAKPMVFSGKPRHRTISVDAILENRDPFGNAAAIERVIDEGGVLVFRDPRGRRYWANLSQASFDEWDDVVAFQATLTETDEDAGEAH